MTNVDLLEAVIISTHTPLAGRDDMLTDILGLVSISTHTPLAGRDIFGDLLPGRYAISTHTPLAGRDMDQIKAKADMINFYSHAPRGARHRYVDFTSAVLDFYSHAPRGARLDRGR